MTSNRYLPAQLDSEGIDKLRNLEGELGKVVVALEPELPVATLSDDALVRVRQMEQELGVVLVAYGADAA